MYTGREHLQGVNSFTFEDVISYVCDKNANQSSAPFNN